MNQDQVALVLAKASAAYPNNAPNLKQNPQIFKIWCEMLADVDGELALKNLKRHIQSSAYFPTIAEIARKDDEAIDSDQLLLETSERFNRLEEWESRAVDCPEHLLPKRRVVSDADG